MNQDQRETPLHVGSRLPVRMAQHPAPIRRIYFYDIGGKRNNERAAREKIPHDRLQVAIHQSPARSKPGQPLSIHQWQRIRLLIFVGSSRGM
jgi:hypothetical protein